MQIIIDNKQALIKEGSSFEYVSENRLFTGSDAYTLAITFPLKDCPQNLAIFGNINRKDISLNRIVFDCEIRDRSFSKFGSITVVETSETEVKCQFLEGRSEQNFDITFVGTYINELELGGHVNTTITNPRDLMNPDFMDFKYVAMPWVNNNSDSGLAHNFVEYGRDAEGNIVWRYENINGLLGYRRVTFQPFLNYIIKKIAETIGYSIDITALEENEQTKYLLICNTLPYGWRLLDFARALPHWTVEEFFSKLETFLNGEFNIDHRQKTIKFNFTEDILINKQEIAIDSVLEAFSTGLSNDGSDCEYLLNKSITYKSEDTSTYKYGDCQWYIDMAKEQCVTFNTLEQLSDHIMSMKFSNGGFQFSDSGLYFVKEVNSYCVFRLIGRDNPGQEGSDGAIVTVYWKPQMLNYLASRINRDDNAPVEELDIVPVSIELADITQGFCIFLNPNSYSEDNNDVLDPDNPDLTFESSAQLNIENGEGESTLPEYYDKIHIAWWNGEFMDIENNKQPHPYVANIEFDFKGKPKILPFSFDLRKKIMANDKLPAINPKIKYTFKFLADSIPDVRAVFYIQGKKYICEKISATFTENGLSQLLKGEFYRVEE